MSVERRVLLCRLIEDIYKEKEFCDRVGIINVSTFEGAYVDCIKSKQTKAVKQQP